jgi:hypothetical protein
VSEVPPAIQPGEPGYDPYWDGYSKTGNYDRQGNPITMRQWAVLHSQESYKRVASDYLDDGSLWVSTVWLGMDHGFGRGLLIFETMVFVQSTPEQVAARREAWRRMTGRDEQTDFPWEGELTERYATEDEAATATAIS